tara:strand:- start:7871 stop:9175 length:1305 start_codon:yes stop_codon:yes gene_type:complete
VLKRFKEHIEKRFPFLLEDDFLLACSGGVDSVVLAHLCQALKMDFSLVHCNFKLRGKDSDGDQRFVEELAHRLNKPFLVRAFDTLGYINQHGGSVQMAARELRYAWFSELLQNKEGAYVLTAHHADDDLETFLINLARGTGIDGLTGIPEQNGGVVRPLLPFCRNDIVGYAKKNGIAWREDRSNTDTKYLRNKIRHQLIGGLKELHPTFLENFQRTQEHLSDSSALLKSYKAKLQKELFEKSGDTVRIQISALIKLEPQGAHLHLILGDYGFTEWNNVLELLNAMSGKQVVSATHRLVKDREHLLLSVKAEKDDAKYEIGEDQRVVEHPIKLRICQVDKITPEPPNVLYVDKETLNYPLLLRKWQKGDYFYPFGMKGKKKVSKFFKDEKMDILAKQKQWLLCSGNQIVWVIGKRADDRFRVTRKTQEILKFTLL